jgi:pimeloyl-ACP methyl ester carboxylesterase
MATFVLVHGGWSGAHGFRKVRPLLRAAGHEVFTPSLTGIGERAHLTSPSVNLTTHIRDVVNVVLCEDLDDITLLGFAHGAWSSPALWTTSPMGCGTSSTSTPSCPLAATRWLGWLVAG